MTTRVSPPDYDNKMAGIWWFVYISTRNLIEMLFINSKILNTDFEVYIKIKFFKQFVNINCLFVLIILLSKINKYKC